MKSEERWAEAGRHEGGAWQPEYNEGGVAPYPKQTKHLLVYCHGLRTLRRAHKAGSGLRREGRPPRAHESGGGGKKFLSSKVC
jgi:hypothetical protein